jgi:hypothetical protein
MNDICRGAMSQERGKQYHRNEDAARPPLNAPIKARGSTKKSGKQPGGKDTSRKKEKSIETLINWKKTPPNYHWPSVSSDGKAAGGDKPH